MLFIVAVLGALGLIYDVIFPGPNDPSQVTTVAGILLVLALGLIVLVDLAFQAARSMIRRIRMRP